jgi:hypothetical protein
LTFLDSTYEVVQYLFKAILNYFCKAALCNLPFDY